MADTYQQSKTHPYRYTISQLIELAATAYLSFDLSKFTYEAARAGVVPMLGDCAMASRKSSASIVKSAIVEIPALTDNVVYQGNRAIRPDRQPRLPPPDERQKFEGFAKFLKKHSSPTHNRVTAGGRIVPMEPRSPPPFSLPTNVTNRPQAQSAKLQFQDAVKRNHDGHGGVAPNTNQKFDHMYDGIASPSEHPMLVSSGSRNVAEYVADQATTSQSNGINPQHYESQVTMPITSTNMPTSMLSHTMQPWQHMGGPVMHQPQFQPYAMGPYPHTALMGTGMAMPLSPPYGLSTGGMYQQSMTQYPAPQEVMSTQELLKAWERHYNDLDEQLKNIDRHRAMHALDPYLTEQRRVIVQQRSDAKDFVKEYQQLLGIRHHFDSSQDSWATNFNVEAPVYVPQVNNHFGQGFAHNESVDQAAQQSRYVERPRGKGERRIIPIRPPPEDYDDAKPSQRQPNASFGANDNVDVDEWGVRRVCAPPELEREQSELSDVIQAEQMRQLSISQDNYYSSDGGASAASSEEIPYHNDQSQPTASDTDGGTGSIELMRVIPANDEVPIDLPDEYRMLIEAVNQPKGTVTQVRLLGGRVIDVEGQGLGLISASTPAGDVPTDSWPRSDSMCMQSSAAPSRNGQRSRTSTSQLAPSNGFVGKENFSIAPRAHHKAATDAFLSQFNAVNNNMALMDHLETQSLTTASNSRPAHNEPKVSGSYQPSSIRLASRESLLRPVENTLGRGTTANMAKTMQKSDFDLVDSAPSCSPEALNNKGWSQVSVQNVNAVGSLPNNFNGIVEVRQSVQAQLSAASKSRSPRFLRRFGA